MMLYPKQIHDYINALVGGGLSYFGKVPYFTLGEETEAQRGMKLMADTKLKPRSPDGMINCPKFPKMWDFWCNIGQAEGEAG